MTSINAANPEASLIVWSKALSVGIDEIDAQHQTLVDLINQLHRAIVLHRAADEAQPIIDRLVEYTRVHFAVEESLMRLFHYSDYEKHREEHESLIEEVNRLRDKVFKEGKPINFELLHFLKRWLTEHIIAEDRKYSPYFLERGVQARAHRSSWLQRLWQ